MFNCRLLNGFMIYLCICFSYRREESDIPLVVIGCVQEIEKRGG